MKRICSIFLCVVFVLLLLCSCARTYEKSDEMFALDTIITFKVSDSDKEKADATVEKCKDEIRRLEKLLSATDKNSDVYKINHSDSKPVLVQNETAKLIKSACEISKSCDGAFDISVYPLVKLWGFDSKDYKVPTKTEIDDTLQYVNYKDINVDENLVTLKKGMSIDLGGIAKGYIGNRLYSILKEQNVERGLINLGGMIILYSNNSDSDDFTLGVEYPDTSEVFATFKTKTPFTVTSGAYQRFFEENGEKYHHIISPYTGKPSQSDISSVTVIGNDGVENDALSTAFYVMGVDKTLDYIKTHKNKSGQMYSFIMLNADKTELYVSSDLVENGFSLEQKFENEININVIDMMFV